MYYMYMYSKYIRNEFSFLNRLNIMNRSKMLSKVVRIANAFGAQRAFGDDTIWIVEAIFDVLVSMFCRFEEFSAERTSLRIFIHEFFHLSRRHNTFH